MERLQKIIAAAGICSRRKAEELILQGRVLVNGRPARLGQKADPEKDEILIDGKPLRLQRKRYIALYKPRGYLTTLKDPFGRKTIIDLLKGIGERVFPVGRLDEDSEGLLLLTNDGEWANRIAHPRYEVEKEYIVFLNNPLSKEEEEKVRRGIDVDGRGVDVRRFRKIGKRKYLIVIHEGRKRIIRRMFQHIGKEVVRLIRIRIGHVRLSGLRPGQWRDLTPEEIKNFNF